MRKWGERSKAVHETLDPRLQLVVDFILHTIADISLISGHRGEEEQNRLVEEGKSQLVWPKSKHNKDPSLAVDVQPYPMPNIGAADPNIKAREQRRLWASLGHIAGAARVYAYANGFIIRWGGDWDMDGDLTDQKFDDLFHLEIVGNLNEHPE